MFYSHQILAKKGPLGTIWIAAHMDRKLRKNQIADTCIGDSVGACPLWWRPHGFQTRETYVQRAKWAAVARTPSRWLGRLRACGSTSVCRFRVVPASVSRHAPGQPSPSAHTLRACSAAGAEALCRGDDVDAPLASQAAGAERGRPGNTEVHAGSAPLSPGWAAVPQTHGASTSPIRGSVRLGARRV